MYKIHKWDETLIHGNGSQFEGLMCSLLHQPRVCERVSAIIEIEPKVKRVGLMSTWVLNIVQEGNWFTLETMGGVILLERIEEDTKNQKESNLPK